MNCIHVIVPVVYIFLQLKTMRLAAKCQDIACENLKDETTDYRREVFNDANRFTEKGLRFRRLAHRYAVLNVIVFIIGAITLGLIFRNN
jgi:hypothetical protein